MEKKIPGRVFLDTCVVNFLLDYGEQIHDGGDLPSLKPREIGDLKALRQVLLVGQRAMWQLAISPYTYSEIIRTQDQKRLRQLDLWFQELWQYWRSTVEQNNDLPTFIEAEGIRGPNTRIGVPCSTPRRRGPRADMRCTGIPL